MNKRNLTNSSNASDKDGDILQGKKMKSDPTLEQEFINYISIPSLETIAITKLVVELCKQPDLRDEILYKDFDKLEEKMAVKLDILPKLLKDKASNIIQPIGMQICDWSSYVLNDDFPASNDYKLDTDYICWTMEGTIDKKKTLELLISSNIVSDINCIFREACKFCAEDYIVKFKELLSSKKSYREEKNIFFYRRERDENRNNPLVAYWSQLYSSMNEPSSYDYNDNFFKMLVTFCVSEGNVLAVKYFWNKLTHEKISSNIIRWTKDILLKCNSYRQTYQETNDNTEILCFLLSKMNGEEQQREIFQACGYEILQALFYDWRWQKFLLPTVQVIRDFLDGASYVKLLSMILKHTGGKNAKILKEVWCNSPDNLKRCFIQHIKTEHGKWDFHIICECNDVEAIKLILNDVTNEEKQLIIFDAVKYGNCDLIYKDKLNVLVMLDIFSLNILKTDVINNYADDIFFRWICDDNWHLIEKFLKWCFTSENEIEIFKKSLGVYSYFRHLVGTGDYVRVNKFMKWRLSSDTEINQFKENIMHSTWDYRNLIMTLINTDFSLYEKFLGWCFNAL